MLAYLSWHRPAPGVERGAYEQSLERFHRSLAHRPPSGLRGSTSFRAPELPWLAQSVEPQALTGHPGSAASDSSDYEDWYLLDSWSSVGVLEEASISQGHLTAHDGVAKLAGPATSAVYRLDEGHANLADTRLAVWVTRARGHASPTLGDLLGDGMDRSSGGLWRRCIGLGPAPEYCLLAAAAPAGVAAARLPAGWNAITQPREVLWNG